MSSKPAGVQESGENPDANQQNNPENHGHINKIHFISPPVVFVLFCICHSITWGIVTGDVHAVAVLYT